TNQVATPCPSSWGLKGYNEQWLNETNGWTWRHVHVAAERMIELARRYDGSNNPLPTLRGPKGPKRAGAERDKRLDRAPRPRRGRADDRAGPPLRRQHQPAPR